jgi:hypothetical protein
MSDLQPIEIGSYVYWTDPDHATCNAIGTVQGISDNPDGGIDEHSIYTVKILSGGIVEAPRSELTYISNGSTVRSVTASAPTGRSDSYDLCTRLSREADVEITHHVKRIWPNTRYFKVKAKKGPRTTRTYCIPPTRWMVDMTRGKHRGHLPINMGGTRLFGIGSKSQGIVTDIDEILSKTREEAMKAFGLTAEQMNADFNGGLTLTPEAQKALRDNFGKSKGWYRKKIAAEPVEPVTGVPVRNPLPIPIDKEDKQ